MTSPPRPTRPSRHPLRRWLSLGLILTPLMCLLTFFGLVVASQAALAPELSGWPSAALQAWAEDWLRLAGAPPTQTPYLSAAPDFGPTSAPGQEPADSAHPSSAALDGGGQTALPPAESPEMPLHETLAVPSATPSPTGTLAPMSTATPSATQTASPSSTPTPSGTPVRSNTPTPFWTTVPTWTPSRTATRTPTRTPTTAPQTSTPSPPVQPTDGSPPPATSNSPSPTATLPAPSATPSGSCSPTGNPGYEATLLGLINAERQSRDLAPYASQSQLQAAARGHAVDMACNGFFSHTGSDGSSVGQRVSAQGYSWSWVGENIFATSNGSSSAPQQAFDWWMNSSAHRANLLSPNYTEIGLGFTNLPGSDYGNYFVAVFARP